MSRLSKPDTPPPGGEASTPDAIIADPLAGRLALRLGELANALGISRRTLERERSAGRFPPPNLTIGKAPLWKPETIRRWIDGGGNR